MLPGRTHGALPLPRAVMTNGKGKSIAFKKPSEDGYGSIPSGPSDGNDEPSGTEVPGSFGEFLVNMGLRSEADPYRLDIAKFVLITLFVAGNFVRPFAHAQNKVALVLHNFVNIFTIPAFTMITGYLSAEMTRPRRRFLVAYIVIPYIVLQSVYLGLILPLYWRTSFRNNHLAPGFGEYHRNNGQFSYNYTPQPNWGPLSYFTPAADLWYFFCILWFSIWRPYAVEVKHTVLVHVVLGCLFGYTSINRFMGLHRTVLLMPYFLAGHMLRRYKIFVPYANTWPKFCMAVTVMVVALAAVILAVYAFGHNNSHVWMEELGYQEIWKEDYRWGGMIQLFVYLVSSALTAAFFALLPPASITNMLPLVDPERGHQDSTMRREEDDIKFEFRGYTFEYSVGDPDDVETEYGCAGDPLLVRSRRKGEAAERDQKLMEEAGGGRNWHAIVYLRLAKWGSRCLSPLTFNFLVMIVLECCTWYDVTWWSQDTDTEAWQPNGLFTTIQAVFTFLLGAIVALLLSLRPATMVLGWLLAPPLNNDWFFEQDDVSMKKQETKRKLKIAEDIKAELSVGSLD